MMLQLKYAVDQNPMVRSRFKRLSVFKGNVVTILNSMLRHKSDFEAPAVQFMLAGFCWFEGDFLLWRIYFQESSRESTAERVTWRDDNVSARFIGDYTEDAESRLTALLNRQSGSEGLDLQPFEVLRDMLLEGQSDPSRYRRIGGAPQVLKLYRSLNRVPIAVSWRFGAERRATLLGRPVHNINALASPFSGPDVSYSIQHELVLVDGVQDAS